MFQNQDRTDPGESVGSPLLTIWMQPSFNYLQSSTNRSITLIHEAWIFFEHFSKREQIMVAKYQMELLHSFLFALLFWLKCIHILKEMKFLILEILKFLILESSTT